MKRVTLNIEDFFEVPTAIIYNPDELKPVSNVSIDSRKVKKGSLFIAIKGKRYDGHNFVRDAINNGAIAAVVNRGKLKEFDDVELPLITVKNTTKALGDIARMWRNKLNAVVIGLTGSTGKTSVKDMMTTLLKEKYRVQKTESNNNNNIGVPLTILSANEKHDVLVAEVGTNHFGEIEYSTNILEPDYALITNIGSSHLEFLKSKKGVLKEKIALFNEAKRRCGKILINYDDPMLKQYADKFSNSISYGINKRADISGRVISYTDEGKPVVELKYKNRKIGNLLPLAGKLSADNYMAAAAVALELGLTNEQIKNGTKKLSVTEKRLNIIHLKNFLLIDDTYNANPDSVKAAIELVARIKTYNRKVLILGDMFELGKNKIMLHRSLSSPITKNKMDEIYTIGSGMKALSDSLKNKKLIVKHFRTRKLLENFLGDYNSDNTVILVKGSRRMRMEDFVKIILTKVKK